MHGHLLPDLALTVVVATLLGIVAKSLKQPTILAYMIAGIIVGPNFGFKLITEEGTITLISEIGLVLLMFMTGLEIEIKHLRHTPRSVITTGLLQVALTFLLGLLVFSVTGVKNTSKHFDLTYLAFALSLSSIVITTRLLYDNIELDTLPGRISIGILLTQDVYALLAKAIQPSLGKLSAMTILVSFGRAMLLVFLAIGLAQYVLQHIYRFVAKTPELVLVLSLAWLCAVCALARQLNLSLEMGALIAGVSVSALPYHIDIIAKVISIRDFFLLLFFASIGMKVPEPSYRIVMLAVTASLFVILTRPLTVSTFLHYFGHGNRASLIPAINVAHVSEFSVIIAALGYQHYHHIHKDILSVVVFTFAIMSALSAYMISRNHELFLAVNKFLPRVGIRDIEHDTHHAAAEHEATIALVGFYSVASSLMEELEQTDAELRRKLLVIDFNPHVITELRKRNISCVYGDVAHLESLDRAGIDDSEMIVSTIPDVILKGTDNARILHHARRLRPDAKIIVTADSIEKALELYEHGADYVFLPRLLSARHLAEVLERAERGDLESLREEQMEALHGRNEILK